MRKNSFLFGLMLLLLTSCYSRKGEVILQEESPLLESHRYGFPEVNYDLQEGVVERGDFFASLLNRLGASNDDIYQLVELCKGQFDLKKIKIGNRYRAYYSRGEEPKLAYFIYEASRRDFIIFGLEDSLSLNFITKEISSKLKRGEATIENSLWEDLSKVGIEPLLALRLSEIYAWSIDFFGLQKGDNFQVLYEELYIDDHFWDIGEIYAANFRHRQEEFEAYRFVQDDIVQYWNGEGVNLRKAFLKAPLNFTRISSGFTYARRHPITRVVRPHTGVDYAAPAGTPVVTIGDGVVVQKRYTRGGGNELKIKHNSTYSTAYLHLSRYGKGIAVGKRVRQGEVIGYVGSTGMSTGPHLDFRVWKNGTPVNPLTMKSPPADPLKEENREPFEEAKRRVGEMSDSLLSIQYIDTLLIKIGVTQ